jgi:hypothetical protein
MRSAVTRKLDRRFVEACGSANAIGRPAHVSEVPVSEMRLGSVQGRDSELRHEPETAHSQLPSLARLPTSVGYETQRWLWF